MERLNINKAIFLDRDGVINNDFGYIGSFEQFEFMDGIIEFLLTLKHNDFKLFIITNQSGIGRGFFTEEEYHQLTNIYLDILKTQGIKIEEVKYCPHTPQDNCECRKPKPTMILEIIEKYNLDKNECFLIGDKQSDIQAASNAGIKGIIKTNQVSFECLLDKIFF